MHCSGNEYHITTGMWCHNVNKYIHPGSPQNNRLDPDTAKFVAGSGWLTQFKIIGHRRVFFIICASENNFFCKFKDCYGILKVCDSIKQANIS
jgi:hypothetical protein